MLKLLKKHKRVATVSLLLLCLTVGTTLAAITKQTNSLTNSFTPGSVETIIDEPEVEVDGNKIIKKPYVENTGKNDALIRARVTISPSELVSKYEIEIEYNMKCWTQVGEWWYYNEVLPAPEENKKSVTEPLFTEVTGKNIVNDGKIIKELEGLEIAVYHESVQTVMIKDDGTPIEAKNGIYKEDSNAKYIWDYISSLDDQIQD